MGGKSSVEQQATDDLVDGIVTTHVFANQLDSTIDGYHGGRMDRTGLVEESLFDPHGIGHRQHGVDRELRQSRRLQGCESLDQFIDGLVPAQTATRRRAAETWGGSRCSPTGFDRHHVEFALGGRSTRAITHTRDRMTVQQTIRETEPHCEFVVMTRSAHGGGHEFTIELDRHGLFHHEAIGCTARTFGVDLHHENGVDALTSHTPKATVRRVTTDEPTHDDDPSWDLIRPAGGEAYNTRRSDPISDTIPAARERDPLLAADPDGTSWLLTPDSFASRREDDRSSAILYGAVTFIATAVVGLIVTLAVTSPAESTPITTPVVSFTPRPTSSITTDSSSEVSAVANDDAPVAAPDSPPGTTTTTIPTDSSVGTPIVVASSEGVFREASAGTTRVFDGTFDVVLPVGDGSYLVQARSGRDTNPLETSVLRISPGSAPIRILEPAEGVDEWFTLHDVGVRNGSFTALVTVATGTLSDDSIDDIVLVPLDSRERQSVFTRDAWRSTIVHLTLGDEFVVGDVIDESSPADTANRPLLLRIGDSPDGGIDIETIAPTPYGLADSYSGCFVCPRVFAVDALGEQLGWIEGDLLVITDIATKQRLLSVPLPQGTGERVMSVEIGGNGVLLNRRLSRDGPFQKALVVTGDGSIGVSNYFGRAAFPRDVAR